MILKLFMVPRTCWALYVSPTDTPYSRYHWRCGSWDAHSLRSLMNCISFSFRHFVKWWWSQHVWTSQNSVSNDDSKIIYGPKNMFGIVCVTYWYTILTVPLKMWILRCSFVKITHEPWKLGCWLQLGKKDAEADFFSVNSVYWKVHFCKTTRFLNQRSWCHFAINSSTRWQWWGSFKIFSGWVLQVRCWREAPEKFRFTSHFYTFFTIFMT